MVNWKLLFFFISTSTSKDFGTFYLTEEEWIDLDLHDYFSSNEVSFYISNTNSSSNDIVLYQNSSIELVSHVKHEAMNEPNFYDNNYDENFPVFVLNNIFLAVWYKGKEIILYFLTESKETIEILWKINIGSRDCKGEITQIQKIPHKTTGYLIILLRCQINSSLNIWKNEIYMLDLEKYYEIPIPIHANLWDIKYLNNIQISSQSHLNSIAIYGSFQSGKQIAFIYEFLSKPKPCLKLIQSIDYYPEHYKFHENNLNLAQIQFSLYHMVLLDSIKGVFSYDFNVVSYKYENTDYIDLTKYGNLYSLHWLSNKGQNYNLAVGSDKGVIILVSRFSAFNIIKWLNIFDIIGYIEPIYSLCFLENFLILKASDTNTSILLIFEIKGKYYDTQLISIIDLNLLVGDWFNPLGMWSCMKSISGNKFYLRDDYDGIRLYYIEPKDWTLRIWGNHSFYAEIAAKPIQKNKKHIRKSLNVISIPIESNEIYKIANYQILDSYISINSIFNGDIHIEQIRPKHYFSGPNLTYSISNIEFPNDFSVEILAVNEIKDAIFIELEKPPYIIKHAVDSIIMISEDGLLFLDVFNGKTKNLNCTQNITDIIWGRSTDTMVILESDYKNNHWASIYIQLYDFSSPLKFITNIEYEGKCTFFKTLHDFLGSVITVCVTNKTVSIHRILHNYYVRVFPKIQLNEYGINSVISLDADILKYSPIVSIYFLDKYRGLLSIECNIEQFLCEARQSFFSINTLNVQKVLSSDNFVYLICFDLKIRVLNPYLHYLKTLSPHAKGTIINSYAIFNMVVLQINNHIIVLDPSVSSHDSMVRSFDIDGQCQLIRCDSFDQLYNSFMFIAVICKNTRIIVYEFQCDYYMTSYNNCPFTFITKIYLKSGAIFKESEFRGKIGLIAQNSYDKAMVDINYKISLVDNNIRVNFENIPKEIEMDCNKAKNISLKEAFKGSDIRNSIKLNNISDEQEWQDIFPVKLHQIYQNSFTFSYNNAKFYEQIPLEGINKYLLATKKEFIILDEKENFKIDKIIPIETILNRELDNCTPISFIGIKNYSSLIAMICTYYNSMKDYWNEQIINLNMVPSKALVVFEYEAQEKSITRSIFMNIDKANYHIRTIKTSNFRFDIFLIKKASEHEYPTNFVYWYKGIWNQELLSIDLEKEIDYSLLGINNFFAKSIDAAIFKESQIVLYITDTVFGLRVLLIDENSQITIVESIPNPDSIFSSVCYSQDKLYATTFDGYLFRYSIASNGSLIFEKSAYTYPIPSYDENFNYALTCMKEKTVYVVSTFLIRNDLFLRIWNDMKWTDIKMNILLEDNQAFRVRTIGHNQISVLNDKFFTFQIWTLIDSYIEISPISKENFPNMKKMLGTEEIELEIYAYNKFKKTESAIIDIKWIDQNSSYHLSTTWIIICFAIVIFILFGFIIIIIVLCKKKKIKMKNNFKEEGLSLQEIKYMN